MGLSRYLVFVHGLRICQCVCGLPYFVINAEKVSLVGVELGYSAFWDFAKIGPSWHPLDEIGRLTTTNDSIPDTDYFCCVTFRTDWLWTPVPLVDLIQFGTSIFIGRPPLDSGLWPRRCGYRSDGHTIVSTCSGNNLRFPLPGSSWSPMASYRSLMHWFMPLSSRRI
jgi:hypothetical protein